jgi:hypothetical protein
MSRSTVNKPGRERGELTTEIEIVASANGSPRILSMLIERTAPVLLPLISIWPFIFRSDGECSDP